LLDTDKWISTFGEDQAGNLYFADRVTGEIYMLTMEVKATFLPVIIR